MSDLASCKGTVAIGYFTFFVMNFDMESIDLSNRLIMYPLISKSQKSLSQSFASISTIFYSHGFNQLIIKGFQPKSSTIIYTIPHRETVAGEATLKSITSNSILIDGSSFILYPFAKHSIILSSKTVFMFSIQRASTGPSKITQFITFYVSSQLVHYLIIDEANPSFHY